MSFPYQPGCVAAVMFLETGCGQEGRTSSLQLEARALACLSKQLLYHQPGPRLPSFRLKGYWSDLPSLPLRVLEWTLTCPLVQVWYPERSQVPSPHLRGYSHCRLLLQIEPLPGSRPYRVAQRAACGGISLRRGPCHVHHRLPCTVPWLLPCAQARASYI